MKKSLIIVLLLCSGIIYSQKTNNYKPIDVMDFDNSAKHWYYIYEEKIINPSTEKPQYKSDDIINIADNILLFQKENGGWAKNYDMLAILTEDQKDTVLQHKSDTDACFDNGTTWGQLNYLAKVYQQSKIEKYKIAYIKGIEYLLNAQYPNGGFPQYYPDTTGYAKHITYNDGAMIGVMKILKAIVDGDSVYCIVSEQLLEKVKKAYNAGVECILKTQISNNGKMTAWCQQYDENTLLPINARTFEPAAICNEESAEIVEFLMSIENPSEQIINAIDNAVNWFEESKIEGIRVQTIQADTVRYKYSTMTTDRIIEKDVNAPTIWARYYDLNTLKPIFCNRDGHIVNSFEEVDRERRAGYGWYTYSPTEVLEKYKNWKITNVIN